jgi:hypothetical protein
MAKAAKVDTPTPDIVLPKMDIQKLNIRLVSDAPLICHAWAKKAKQEMLDKQMKKAKPAKDAKNPDQDYKDSLYHLPNGSFGFPSIAFKSAAVDACSHVDGITKVEARGAFHIIGDLLKINGEPSPREDMVRIGMGTADLRYRGMFAVWSVDVPLRFNASVLSAEQIIHLFNMAGFGIGIGEWRPQRDGQFGLFHVEGTQ